MKDILLTALILGLLVILPLLIAVAIVARGQKHVHSRILNYFYWQRPATSLSMAGITIWQILRFFLVPITYCAAFSFPWAGLEYSRPGFLYHLGNWRIISSLSLVCGSICLHTSLLNYSVWLSVKKTNRPFSAVNAWVVGFYLAVVIVGVPLIFAALNK